MNVLVILVVYPDGNGQGDRAITVIIFNHIGGIEEEERGPYTGTASTMSMVGS